MTLPDTAVPVAAILPDTTVPVAVTLPDTAVPVAVILPEAFSVVGWCPFIKRSTSGTCDHNMCVSVIDHVKQRKER